MSAVASRHPVTSFVVVTVTAAVEGVGLNVQIQYGGATAFRGARRFCVNVVRWRIFASRSLDYSRGLLYVAVYRCCVVGATATVNLDG